MNPGPLSTFGETVPGFRGARNDSEPTRYFGRFLRLLIEFERRPGVKRDYEALREAIARRPEPKKPEHAGLVFLTRHGAPWAKPTADNPIATETGKLLRKLGINGRKGRGFYTLRHVFRTVADGAKDQPAADFIMGHEVPHMSNVYRETIGDEHLRAVTDQVRAWLFAESKPASKSDEEE